MIDLHCHLLPGIDDGPPDMNGALALARGQVQAGVRLVTVTPHVTWDLPANDAPRIRAAVDELRGALAAAAIELEILTGAEIAITRAADFDDAQLSALSIGGDSPWLLVESPLSPAAVGFEAVLHHLQVRGHRILLAHPERCPAFQRDPAMLERCVEAGMLTSITAGALVGRFGARVRAFAFELAASGLIHNVASDAHDAIRRPPGIRAELEAAGLASQCEWWTTAVPAALIAGATELPSAPPPPPPPPVPESRPRRWNLARRLSRGADQTP